MFNFSTIDEEREVQRGSVTHPGSHSKSAGI